MKEDHFIPLPDWFFDMSILSWIGLNYLVFYISKSIPAHSCERRALFNLSNSYNQK